jgi:hypothetical protein
MKMVAEDVVEEHNGLYGGKWHIISHEGFDLPEGLEYLKNSCGKNNQKYKANITVKNIPLRIIFEETYSLLWRSNIESVVLEICTDNERERDPLLKFKETPFLFLDELVVHGCHITIEDIADVIFYGIWNGVSCQFSNNIFVSKNFDDLDFLEAYFKKKPDAFAQRSIGRLDLRNCNFSKEETDILKNKLECCGCRNLLI